MSGAHHNGSASTIGKLEERLPPEARQKLQAAGDKSLELLRGLKSEIKKRPYVAVGLCFGLGIVAGAWIQARRSRLM